MIEFLTSVSFILLMSQPIGNVGYPWYIYKCGKKKQYLCAQTMGGVQASNWTVAANSIFSVQYPPTTLLPVPTKIHFSGFVSLSSAVPVNVFFSVYNIYGKNYYVYVNWELQNNGTIINVPDQEIVLEPYTFTGALNTGLAIQPSATVTVNNFYMYAYVEVPEE